MSVRLCVCSAFQIVCLSVRLCVCSTPFYLIRLLYERLIKNQVNNNFDTSHSRRARKNAAKGSDFASYINVSTSPYSRIARTDVQLHKNLKSLIDE